MWMMHRLNAIGYTCLGSTQRGKCARTNTKIVVLIAALSLECREHACKPACCGAASILPPSPPPQPQQGQHQSRPNRRRRAIDTYLDTSISSIRRHAIQPKQRMPTFDFDGESNLYYHHATTVEPAITTQPTMLSMIMVLLVIVMCMECCMQCIIF